ncbi:glycoside hydrolase family 3 protein [Kribbella capetownensis]|uniref:Glycoside hydrolase family 3 protein n=1 Tax=Kribbella capetownensis TaxID=1572659 RepID=A0A4R0JQH9_9ACTN|nr:glycoside hydrolase family 3 N-terminal domain-containing protein [Kribbella capetownensis]TCC44265.1 glycoside hydrolase family 3 protein [Kribbella capetownensis]
MSSELKRLAHGVLFPALGRPKVPHWVGSRIEAGLGGFVIFGKDIVDGSQFQGLAAELHGLRDHVLLSIDEEGGDVSRLANLGGFSMPGNRALGELNDVELTRQAAFQIGLSLVEAGVDWDLAPAVDTAVNPLSPNGIRCFGADRDLVSRHTAAWVEGMQAAGVSACAKHYPGHGMSGTDAHLATPLVDVSRDELLASYLDPFRAAIEAGVDSIMVSHDLVPQLDDVPATISKVLLTDILRGELGYDGVVITDALEMYGIADVAPLPEAAVRAIEAGADALCLGSWAFLDDVDVAATALVEAVENGRLPLERLQSANERLARLGTRPKADVSLRDNALGERLAEQVVVTHGDPVLRADAVLIIRLEPTHSPAAGSSGWGVEKLLRDAGKVVESIGLSGQTYNGPGMARAGVGEFRSEYGADSQVVLMVRGAHRFDWQEKLIGELQSQHPDMIVVDMGVSGTDYSGFASWIQTFGSARVCAEAATRRLLGS